MDPAFFWSRGTSDAYPAFVNVGPPASYRWIEPPKAKPRARKKRPKKASR